MHPALFSQGTAKRSPVTLTFYTMRCRRQHCSLLSTPTTFDTSAHWFTPSLGFQNETLSFDVISVGVCSMTISLRWRKTWKASATRCAWVQRLPWMLFNQPKNSIWWLTISFDLFLGISRSWMISSYKRTSIDFPPTPICCGSVVITASAY